MVRVLPVAALAFACMMILASSNAHGDDTDNHEIGNFWTYDLEMEIDPMTLNGEVTYRIDGTKTETVAGVTYDVYDMGVDGSLSITGSYLGMTIGGTATLTYSISVEINEFDEIRSDSNLSMSITMEGGVLLEPYEYVAWVHTVTTYSPPGGVGDVPDEPKEGDSWVLTYTLHQETTEYEDGEVSSESDSHTETRTYTYIGRETVTVPAGTFDCEVVQEDDGDDIETYWVSEDVGAEVKSVYESVDGDGVYVLTSYSYTPKSDDSLDMTLLLIIGSVVAVVAVVAVIVLLMLRKKPMTPQVMPGEPATVPASTGAPVEPPPAQPPPETPPQ